MREKLFKINQYFEKADAWVMKLCKCNRDCFSVATGSDKLWKHPTSQQGSITVSHKRINV